MKSLMFASCVVSLASSCVSLDKAVNIVDRQTVMESEASAEWPTYEEQFFNALKQKGTSFIPEEKETEHKRTVYNILNSDFAAE